MWCYLLLVWGHRTVGDIFVQRGRHIERSVTQDVSVPDTKHRELEITRRVTDRLSSKGYL